MADDFGFQPIAQPSSPVDDFGFQPLPKMPDTSGVQKMAQQNLANHANQEAGEDGQPKQPLSPQERLNIGAGFPVDKVVNGVARPNDFTQEHRDEYVKGLDNGSWVNSADAMPTWLHSLASIAAGLKPDPNGFLAHVGQIESGAWADLHPADKIDTNQNLIAQLGQAASPTLALLSLPFSPALAIGGAIGQEIAKQSYEPEEWESMSDDEKQKILNVSSAAGQGVAGIATAAVPLGHPSVQESVRTLFGDVLPPEKPPVPGEQLQIGGRTLKDVTPPAEGHWDNHPGSEPIIEHVAKQLGKEPSEITTSEVDHAIAEGSKDLMPSDNDFKTVSSVTGIPEAGLKNIFKLAGVIPEQVFSANQKDKSVGQQVANNEVPEQWKHLVPEQTAIPEATAPVTETLEPAYHFDTDSYGVKNGKGEFVQTGFGSEDEAKDYIEKHEERAAIQEEGNHATAEPSYERPEHLEKTSTAEQAVIPGAEQISERALVERKMESPLKGGNAPLEGGLFDVAGRGQGDIFEQKPKEKPKTIIPPSESGKPTSLRTFLSNNGAKFNEANKLVSIKQDGQRITGQEALDHAHALAKEYGYLPKDEAGKPASGVRELQDHLTETNGGREATRDQDADRVAKMQEVAQAKQWKDPAFIEDQAHKAGIDTDVVKDESAVDRTKRLLSELKDYYTTLDQPVRDAITNFWGDESGAVPSTALREIRDTIAPTMAGEGAQKAAIAIRNAYGVARRERAIDEATLSNVAKIASKMDDTARRDFYKYVEGRSAGIPLNDKELQPLADSVRAVYQRMRSRLETMPETRMMNFVQDYFTHQWKDKEAAQKFVNDFIAAQGSGRALKKRLLPTIEEGLNAGLELEEPNPVRAVSRYLGSMNNYIASVEGLRTIVHDLGAEYYAKGLQPEGYEPLVGRNAERIEQARVDPISNKMIPARNMQLYAPADVARIYNRFYSKGFENTLVKSTYELSRDAINANTMFELGLSTYHLGTINIQSINQDVARVMKNAIVGDWKGVANAVKKLSVPGLHYLEGKRLVDQYKGLADHGINMEAMAEHFAKANLRIGQDPLSVVSKKGFVEAAHRRLA